MKTNLLMVCIAIAMLFATAGCDDEWHMGTDPETVEKRIVLSPKRAEDAARRAEKVARHAEEAALRIENAARRAEDAVRRIEDAARRAATETNPQDIQDSSNTTPNEAN